MIGRRKAPLSPDDRIELLDRVVRERVDSGRSTGIAAGLVFADGQTSVVAHGDAGEGRPVAEHTAFEIGSITKVFTSTLLADMAQRGELRLEDPVASLLPPGTSVPARGGRQITLEDLATHTSGLPSMPADHAPADPRIPFADFTVEDLYAFLADVKPERGPGAKYEYSNIGAGLLGHALALRAHTAYEELVRERILAPLGMTSTAITLPAGGPIELARGHDPRGRLAPYFDLPVLAGAGALRSTLPDMLRFAAGGLEGGDTPLQRAMATTREPRRKVALGMRIGLGWHIIGTGPRSLLTHSGGTAGFSTSIGLLPARGSAVVVLANSRQTSVEDIALHALEPRLPLRPPPKHREEIELPAALLERYTGVYDIDGGARVTITHEPEGLVVHVPGEDPNRLYAETRTRFFFKDMEAHVVFRRNGAGAVVHQDGGRVRARKIA
jgi:D-alanyl-D-alanine-carboxypeptidase/D-alanyl-D-alanine-endopeptidase